MLLYEIKQLVAILYLKKNLVNWTDSEHLYTVNFDNLFFVRRWTYIDKNK